MRYLLIDRITRLEYNRHVRAIKCISLSDDIFTEHFFGYPVMPGALLLECLAQAGTALVEVSANFEMKAFLIMIEQAKFRKFVRPGDQLLIDLKMQVMEKDYARMDGEIRCGERQVATARLTFGIRKMEEFHADLTKQLIDTMYNVWLRDAEMVGFP